MPPSTCLTHTHKPKPQCLTTHTRRYLDVPQHATWNSLMMEGKKGVKGALKGSLAKRVTMSGSKFFQGMHPDGGTMRLALQVGGHGQQHGEAWCVACVGPA